ncbi:hypothetical protein PV761_15280 [Arthrobacter sp. CC3]|jgi:hypothetical protein|uniref:hypothetical protein n=1 Tax=Arthrobacter sp. CC3 TaxID=3029185 RepID=UPI003264BC07
MTNSKQGTDFRLVDDWASLDEAEAEIVLGGQTVVRGTIDGVTEDGSIVWLRDNIGYRRLYERSVLYEVWVPRGNTALNYKLTKTGP